MNHLTTIFIILFTFISIKTEKILNSSSMYRLYQGLFNGYNNKIRPVIDNNHITFVNITLVLLNLVGMNDHDETLDLNGYLDLEWFDEGLKWNPIQYENISFIYIPSNDIWKPDLILYSAIDQESWDRWSNSNIIVKVYFNGFCVMSPPALIKVYCQLNIQNYPFDEKSCLLKFGSWMYPNTSIKLNTIPETLTEKYTPNDEWDLYKTKQYIKDEIFESGSAYSIMNVELNFKRRSLFYSFNYILPSIILTICSIFGFLLPPHSGEKISLQMTNLLTIVLFLQNIANIVPRSSLGVAKISIYFFVVSILCMFSLIGNIFILHIHNKDVRIEEMSKLFEKLVCVYLARFLRIKKLDLYNDDSKIEEISRPLEKSQENGKKKFSDLENRLDKLEFRVNKLKYELSRKRINEIKKLKWKFAAVVFDRFFFCLSIFLFSIVFISFILTTITM